MFKRLRRRLDNLVSLRDIEEAAEAAVSMGTEAAYKTFAKLWTHFGTYSDVRTFDSGPDMIIECPDDGKQIAYRGRCPKCGGASWVPAGHAGGIPDQQRYRRMRLWTEEEAAT